MGSASNGWLYNGTPAPATIVTTANTVTLTPVCQATHANIAVSVTAGGNNYPGANSSSVTTTAPVYTVTGDEIICSGSKTYSINALPCGATVAWTSSNPSLASVSASGNPATVTRNGTGNGTVLISGVIAGSCGTASVSKSVAVGSQPTSTLFADWDNPLKIIVGADAVTGATSYRWYINNVFVKATTYFNASIPYNGDCSTNVTVGVDVVTPCGTSSRVYTTIGTAPCDNFYIIAPNPAQDMITITAGEQTGMTAKTGAFSTSASSIAQVKIYNTYGATLKTVQYTGTTGAGKYSQSVAGYIFY